MAIFQTSVLKKYLQQQDQDAVTKAYKKYTKYFHDASIQQNIRDSKEEQYQAKFLDELFVHVLGYTLNPQPKFNLTTEFKNISNSRKADGAILLNDAAIAVIELKGTNTKDLESIRQQAFDYKANQPECVYVITSNFEKLRFYINNAVDFEEFDLFALSYNRFELLYLCLHKDHLLKHVPLKIKEASIHEEEAITKKFYSDYSNFKRELFRDMVKRNLRNPALKELGESSSKKELFKKTQKLLDRFLFIFFGEDRGLLPPNSIPKILEQWESLKKMDAYTPLYERYKKYFGYLNEGWKGQDHEIFAYNGGLFKPDVLLDTIDIDDELLFKHTSILTKYDFESQVDVNILGHIFEHSLNEIESVNAEIDGVEFDKQKTKRKKDGVFYTPKYITKYIVDNTVGKLCEEKKAELDIQEEEYLKGRKNRAKTTLQQLDEKLTTYRNWLLELTICDPACGSGAFLNQALDFLITEHRWVDEMSSKLIGGGFIFPDIENSILEKNIYGVDLNDESVEIAKLSLWLRTAQKGRKLTSLNSNIKCGNSLIDSKAVAGDKAFNWEKEFPEVFAKGGFDVVIGNPPYVRAELLKDYISYLQRYKVFNSASDLFAYFYELGTIIIKPEVGIMGYISNTFDKTTAGKVLRDYLVQETKFEAYIDFTEVQVFDGATTYPVILTLQKNKTKDKSKFKYIKIPKNSQSSVIDIDFHTIIEVAQKSLSTDGWSFLSADKNKLFERLKKLPNVRDQFGKCYYGVKTALNEAFIVQDNFIETNHIKPILEGKEIKKWNTPNASQSLILFKSKWTRENYGDGDENIFLSKLTSDFSEIMNHLVQFEEKAKKRYDKGEYWWELRNCAYYDLFEKPKIIFPNLQNSNKFCLDSKGVYINAPSVFLPSDSKTLLCILNSKLIWKFLESICVIRSGGYIEVKPQYFEQIPIPAFKSEREFDEKADVIINKTNVFQNIDLNFQKYLNQNFKLDVLSRKLQSWHTLTFPDFIKELNKAIKTAGGAPLTKKDEMEWMELFEAKKKEALELKAEIDRTDREIDQLVYELYGLTEEEIKIVEGS